MVWKKVLMYSHNEELELSRDRYSKVNTGDYKRFYMETKVFNERYFFLEPYHKDPQEFFLRSYFFLGDKHFPKHFMFGNFQCLRCGQCCKNWEGAEVSDEQIWDWMLEEREDILKFIDFEIDWEHLDSEGRPRLKGLKEIYPLQGYGCPFCRKVRNRPYYGCKIHKRKPEGCRDFSCAKSFQFANIPHENVEDLIRRVGLEKYLAVVKKKWEGFIRY